MGTNIVDNLAVHATCISNDFLDKYLGSANGDYIKVYLLMLRHKGEQFTVTDAADALNLTDGDIERAVRYWEKQGVFKAGTDALVREELRETCDMEAEAEAQSAATAASTAIPAQAMEQAEQKLEKLSGTVDDVFDDEEFAGILFVAKHVLPTLPSIRQVETLQYMYKDLHMQADVIEYLLEYCASIKKTTSKYLQAVAINWHEQGIVTLAQARELIRSFEEKKTKKKTSGSSSRNNKFLNIEKSAIDYDSIAQKRVLDRMKNGTHECTV
mgnify:FL=1